MTPNLDIRRIATRDELMKNVRILRDGADKASRKVLADADLTFFRGVPIWIGFIDDQPVTLRATAFQKRAPNAWCPYANEYMAFTHPSVRGQGIATEILRYTRYLAIEAGCIRVKCKTGTTHGARFHMSLKDDFWYQTRSNELIVDTALVTQNFPEGTPHAVQQAVAKERGIYPTRPLSYPELETILATTKLSYEV